MIVDILPGQDAGAAGRADGILRIATGKAHTAARQAVHVGGDGLRMAFHAHAGRLVLVRDHIQDVPGLLRSPFRTRCERRCAGRGQSRRARLQELATIDFRAHGCFPNTVDLRASIEIPREASSIIIKHSGREIEQRRNAIG